MTSNSRLRVAICGAGIGGLTCALALSKFPDIEIDVYESAGKLAEIGAGIGLFPLTSLAFHDILLPAG
ncbi:hypothetical protein MPER_07213 [Moniliophthora perniciosa FA553]|nr:hypothetical protein MPER_07213 [Moniliophthora perniciosa FA553]